MYVFYNDGSSWGTTVCTQACLAANADAIITDAVGNNRFGSSLTSVDYNLDGKNDLIVGANYDNGGNGKIYVYYQGSITTENAAGYDAIIDGENGYFGLTFSTGDYNTDGKIDLAISAFYYNSGAGRAYIFYIDGSIPTTAASADVKIDGFGGTWFGYSLVSGDFNADGKIDLAGGAYFYDAGAGSVSIFYNDGSIPTTAASADITILGYGTAYSFGFSLAAADINTDGRTDLIVGTSHNTSLGQVSVFYNDGSYPATAASADVVIFGDSSGSRFGSAILTGDLNTDGRTDLIVGSYNSLAGMGRLFIFYSQNGQVNTTQSITGGSTSDYFGCALATGDFNADGRIDLAVGAYGFSSDLGRVYLFYGDG